MQGTFAVSGIEAPTTESGGVGFGRRSFYLATRLPLLSWNDAILTKLYPCLSERIHHKPQPWPLAVVADPRFRSSHALKPVASFNKKLARTLIA